MYIVDLHAHTRFFHGHRRLGDRFDPVGLRALGRVAARRGLDGVATTNHDYYTPLTTSATTVIPGIEVTSTRGHVLVIGPDPPRETVSGELTPAEVVERAHDRNCAAVVAHPFRNSTVAGLEDVPVDAVEVNGKHPRTRPLVIELAERRGLPVVGGSDAHYPFEVGRAVTVVDAADLTPASIVEAIRDGRVEARVRDGRLDRYVRRFYREIHRRKHPRDRLSRPTPGVGEPPTGPGERH